MLIGRFLGSVGNDFVIGIAVNNGFHHSLVGRALAAETYPNRKRVWGLVEGRVISTLGALCVVVVV